ncbi:class I SAM-dependent methyltransferase [Amycolatopsis sp. WGS_07]|uniref:class I SAM-dependent methyltransferase n=1 Tax=Amycolatopsis sp. WGS_07 TaxID=3076764 RepID=UPI003872B155
MTATGFDAAGYKRDQRENWNAVSEGWEVCREEFETGGASVSALLLELGGVRPGHRVLDVGTGTGDPALAAASAVGPRGRVTGIDLAPDMIERARARVRPGDSVGFEVGDAESLDRPAASFDVVLSRWGLMFVVDRVATLRSLARMLVPGGVLAAATWAAPGSLAPMTSLGFGVLARRLELPPPREGAPSPFSMGDPDVLGEELAEAGFGQIEVSSFEAPFVLSSPERYAEYAKAVTPPGLKALLRERFGSEDDPDTWAEVADAAAAFRRGDGRVFLPSKTLLARAVSPAA